MAQLTCERLDIPGVLLVSPAVFKDQRGFFTEIFHEGKYLAAGMRGPFIQDNLSSSLHGVLRGLHYQLKRPQTKLVSVISGSIFDVAVDIRRGSPTFGRWVSRVLSDENHCQMFIPAGLAHGFCVLSARAEVLYKCTDFYAPDDYYGISWCDPDIGIRWPVDKPVLSQQDSAFMKLADIMQDLLPVYG